MGAAIFLFILLCVIIDYLIIPNITLIFIYLFLIDLILFFFFFVIAIAFFAIVMRKNGKTPIMKFGLTKQMKRRKKLSQKVKYIFIFIQRKVHITYF